MTRDEWERCDDPQAMLRALWDEERICDRGWALFVAACSRRIWPHLSRGCHRVVEAAERFVDGEAGREEVDRAVRAARGLPRQPAPGGWLGLLRALHVRLARLDVSAATVLMLAEAAGASAPRQLLAQVGTGDWLALVCRTLKRGRRSAERRGQCAVLRCLFAHPLTPPRSVGPSLLMFESSIARRLAQAAYADRNLPEGTLDNGRLAVLADALEEGGCTDAALLAHLRSPGPHVRGCFALDAVPSKA